MRRDLLAGVAAGAVGTVALDVVGYLDMAVRARPASALPAEVAGRAAERAGIGLGGDERAGNRKSGIGALLGYAVGVGLGAAYGVVRPALPDLPRPVAAAGLGLAAMTASDLPATVLQVTDPREWGASGWVADLLPHLAYGLAAAAAFDALNRRRG
jgi:hypothetical protein